MKRFQIPFFLLLLMMLAGSCLSAQPVGSAAASGGGMISKAGSIATDRWLEVDLYWFDKDHIRASAAEFLARNAPFFEGVEGWKGIILNVGWLMDYILDWRGDLDDRIAFPRQMHQENWFLVEGTLEGDLDQKRKEFRDRFSHPATGQRKYYQDWTYRDLRELSATLRQIAAEKYGIRDMKVGSFVLAWKSIYGGSPSNWSARQPQAYRTMDDFGMTMALFDPTSRLVADSTHYGAYPHGIAGGMHSYTFFAGQWGDLSHKVGLDALVLRDGMVGPATYSRGGPFGATASPDTAVDNAWSHATAELVRSVKIANPGALVIGYSSAVSAVSDWRINCFDLEKIADEGYLDAYIDQTWAGAWNEPGVREFEYWNRPVSGWTYQMAYMLLHGAVLAKSRVHHYQLTETFDAWECWDVLHTVPEKLKWGIWAYSHAATKVPGGLKMPAGAYISWCNQGKRLLSAGDVQMLTQTLNAAYRDAAQVKDVLGPTIVYNRSAMEWQQAHDPAGDIKEWIDEYAGTLLKWSVPIFSVTRAEFLPFIHTDLPILQTPVHLRPGISGYIQDLIRRGRPVAIVGSPAGGVDPAIAALAGMGTRDTKHYGRVRFGALATDTGAGMATALPRYFPVEQSFTHNTLNNGARAVYNVLDKIPAMGMTELRLVTTSGEKNTFSFPDWAGVRLIAAHDGEEDIALSRLQPLVAVQSFMVPQMDRNVVYGSLRPGGQTCGSGIGVAGRSDLIYELPAGKYSRFEARTGLDAGSEKVLPVNFRVYANDSLLYSGPSVDDTTSVGSISIPLPAGGKEEGSAGDGKEEGPAGAKEEGSAGAKDEGSEDSSPALAVNLSGDRKTLFWDPPEISSRADLPLINLIGGSETPYVLVDRWLMHFLEGSGSPQIPVEAGRPVTIGVWQLKDGSYRLLAGNLEEGLSFGADSVMKVPVTIPRAWGLGGDCQVRDEWRGEERVCIGGRFSIELPHAACTLVSIGKAGGMAGDGGLRKAGRMAGDGMPRKPDEGAPGTLYKVEDGLPAPLAFVPLRIGSVRPAGWLRDWAELAAHGITGHLDEIKTTFRMGWKGVSFDSAMGVDSFGTGWPLEQCAYWLDGLVRLGYLLGDSALIGKARARLDPVVDGVLSGGATFIYWRPKNILDNEFNSWAHSQMGRALVAYYQATKDPRILRALVKVYGDFLLPTLHNQFDGVSGTVNIDPMLETYLLSGDEKVLQNILRLSQRPDIRHIVQLWNEDSVRPGHGVIYYENIRIPALIYPVTGDRAFLNAAVQTLDYAEKSNLLPMGLISSEEHAAGVGSTRYIETCDVAAGPWTINWLMRLTGRREYGDRLERIFFNAGPGAIDKDFKTMSYYQSPNRINQELSSDPIPNNPDAYKYTPYGSEILCCVGNSNRIIPDYIMNMWMRTPDEGLAATLYGPNELRTEVRHIPVNIRSVTTYPFEDRITLLVDVARSVAFPLYLRIPAWCDSPVVRVNGKTIPLEMNDRGFARIGRVWRKGDKIGLLLPMRIRVEQGRETNYPDEGYFKHPGNRGIALSNQPIHNPYTSVYYGPLLFALPIPGIDPNHVQPGIPSNYALDIGPTDTKTVGVLQKGMTGHWKWEIDKSPIVLRVPALQFHWTPTELQPLPAEPVSEGSKTTIDLVPYGVTRFRVSMFPVSERAWEERKVTAIPNNYRDG